VGVQTAVKKMEITREHVQTLLRTRDESFHKGVPASGLFHCREGKLFAEIVREGGCFCGSELLRHSDGVVAWRTFFGDVKSAELAALLVCSFDQRKPVDAVLLGATAFWRVVLTPRADKSCTEAARDIAKIGVLNGCISQVNTILEGIGRVQRSPYVVLEDPSLVTALDYFRRSGCDLDWVKEQVYGKLLHYVPENFPQRVATPEEIVRKCSSYSSRTIGSGIR